MKPTEDLKKEHDELREMFKVMDAMAERLDRNEEVESNHLTEVTDYLNVVVDKNHHAKEENYLFPAMKESGEQEATAPIDELLQEHEESRELLRQMEQSGSSDPATFTHSAREFIKAVGEHMDKEDNDVFPAADKVLSAEAQETMGKDFERTEEQVLGGGRKEQFKESLRRLQETYVQSGTSTRRTTRRTHARRATTGSRSHSRAPINAKGREPRR